VIWLLITMLLAPGVAGTSLAVWGAIRRRERLMLAGAWVFACWLAGVVWLLPPGPARVGADLATLVILALIGLILLLDEVGS